MGEHGAEKGAQGPSREHRGLRGRRAPYRGAMQGAGGEHRGLGEAITIASQEGMVWEPVAQLEVLRNVETRDTVKGKAKRTGLAAE